MLLTQVPIFEQLPEGLRPPTKCKHCQGDLHFLGHWPFCSNYNCPGRVYGRLQKFVDVLDVKGSGESTLQGLAISGAVTTPGQLFTLSRETFVSLDRKGDAHYEKFLQGLQAVRLMTTAQFFASLDIEGIKTWENITCIPGLQTFEEVMAAFQKRDATLFNKAVRVSPEKISAIFAQIEQKMSEIEALHPHVLFKQIGNKLAGKTFCITGSLKTGTRPQIEAKIKELGGRVSSSCSTNTNYLVTNNPSSGSGKNADARRLNIPIITENQLIAMF